MKGYCLLNNFLKFQIKFTGSVANTLSTKFSSATARWANQGFKKIELSWTSSSRSGAFLLELLILRKSQWKIKGKMESDLHNELSSFGEGLIKLFQKKKGILSWIICLSTAKHLSVTSRWITAPCLNPAVVSESVPSASGSHY